MTYRSDFPHKVKVMHHVQIPLQDGVRLSATIWLPEDAVERPVPAILEYLPYRKRDGTTERDALTHPYFAGYGYASIRVDIRGSGDSEGVLKGEYLKQEQDDALEILRWIAAQPWCSGSIGMIGISWGGFNGLQVAARRPKELKAVISVCSTDDRYADDVHAMGGCLLVDKLIWGSTIFAYNGAPPDPALVGDKWREMWLQRLNESGFWLEEWHRRQRRDDFYKQGSICEDYSAIDCPVYLVGGWADAYTNPIFRMLENLTCPKKALIGPWAHKYPSVGVPGPAIGFLQECLRWWDKWLKGKETGIMDEPMLRAWMQDTAPPQPQYEERPGRWVAEDIWPNQRIRPALYPLTPNALAQPNSPPIVETVSICSPQTTGLASGGWCPYGSAPDQALDQRIEAGGSLVFDTAPLLEPLEFLGAPILHLKVSADKPNALVAVTLSEVLPDGHATRLSYGLLNLTHRNGHEMLEAVEPGKPYQVQIKLNVCGQKIGIGSRLRVAISSSYWTTVWPSPEPVTLSVVTGESGLELPVRPSRKEDSLLPAFQPAETATPFASVKLRDGHEDARITTALGTGIVTLEEIKDGGLIRIPEFDWEYGAATHRRFSIHPDDPLSATANITWKKEYNRPGVQIFIEAETNLTVSRENLHLTATLEAYEGKTRVFSRNWDCVIPRDHM
jgi:putative CocE/NonD family hydrolase